MACLATTIRKPRIPENARNGTFSRPDFERLLVALPEYLRDFTAWAYYTGWRAGSIRSLLWENVRDGELLCRRQYSKDRKVHSIPLVGPLAEIIERRARERNGPYVFDYSDGCPIGSYEKAFRSALRKTGLTGKLFHDFRRVCATNLRRAGVSEEVAMRITGHSTNSVFRRYRIVDSSDLREALDRRARYEAELLKERQSATEKVQ